MDNCVVLASKVKQPFHKKYKYDIKWYQIQKSGFYVLFLPYTAQEVHDMSERKLTAAAKKIFRILHGTIKYVLAVGIERLQKKLYRIGFPHIDGSSVFCDFTPKLIRKIMKNRGLARETLSVGIYDAIFTNHTVEVLETIADICSFCCVFTENVTSAREYAEYICDNYGMPVFVGSEYRECDILIALNRLTYDTVSCIVIDVYDENTHLEMKRINTLYFCLFEELAELSEIFGERIDQHIVDFLLSSDIQLVLGKNIVLKAYT